MAWIKTNQEIQNLMQTYQRGFNGADVDLVRSVYAPDPMFIGQAFLTAIGIKEIVALCAGFLSNFEADVQFDITKVVSGAKFPGFPG